MNERFLDWDASASKRLVRMTLAKKLNLVSSEKPQAASVTLGAKEAILVKA